jgi:hypothetical protein
VVGGGGECRSLGWGGGVDSKDIVELDGCLIPYLFQLLRRYACTYCISLLECKLAQFLVKDVKKGNLRDYEHPPPSSAKKLFRKNSEFSSIKKTVENVIKRSMRQVLSLLPAPIIRWDNLFCM